ncbi:hypothetical protein ACFQ49_06160 [Kroppenstedtia eburnea]|uniref:hypothetical protein n=1 Tax=Kroppenstedtia eburnea TaxID=714067 RepID=UPI0036400E32
MNIYQDTVQGINPHIKEQDILSIKPYWKMEGFYVVKACIELINELSEKERDIFLDSISDKWLFFGETSNEALTSVTMEGCKFIKNGVYMVNIEFDN